MTNAPDLQTHRIPASLLLEIEPVNGWQLCALTERDGDGFDYQTYIARNAECDVILSVSRFRFTPSQDRFAWLVRAGFPASPNIGPWDDTDIEMRMVVPELAA